jgi:hypothetical protein
MYINILRKCIISFVTIPLFLVFLFTGFTGINYYLENDENAKTGDYAFAQSSRVNISTSDSSVELDKSLAENASNSNNKGSNQVVSIYPANFTQAIGSISSVQHNETGEPTWILSGRWELTIPEPLKINQTNPSDAVSFRAVFESMRIDGSDRHVHVVSGFNIKGSEVDADTLVLTGAAVVTMKEGAVKEVPVSLTISKQSALKLWIYPWVPLPGAEDYHFGKNPIYGMASSIGTFFTYP